MSFGYQASQAYVELFSPSSDEHDPDDQDYDDAAERAASAQVVQGNVLVLDVESDEDETIPPPRRPSAIKRARSSSDSSSGGNTTSLSKSSLLPATSAQPQRVPPSKKRKSHVVKVSSLPAGTVAPCASRLSSVFSTPSAEWLSVQGWVFARAVFVVSAPSVRPRKASTSPRLQATRITHRTSDLDPG
ncbi:unnamed protein product [Phytophthora fragariaefolia]|uniref:Unnamed protein product n=1 Tax=Phytophthora fragariaefolia TaxID=1490495 RepID=A0A9W6WTL0_9STRA|nr:unnamed protein product [Phytophthora fragariaefolia]